MRETCGMLSEHVARWRKRAFSRHWTTSWGSEVVTRMLVLPAEASWLRGICCSIVAVCELEMGGKVRFVGDCVAAGAELFSSFLTDYIFLMGLGSDRRARLSQNGRLQERWMHSSLVLSTCSCLG